MASFWLPLRNCAIFAYFQHTSIEKRPLESHLIVLRMRNYIGRYPSRCLMRAGWCGMQGGSK
jgi:hypothetical protein